MACAAGTYQFCPPRPGRAQHQIDLFVIEEIGRVEERDLLPGLKSGHDGGTGHPIHRRGIWGGGKGHQPRGEKPRERPEIHRLGKDAGKAGKAEGGRHRGAVAGFADLRARRAGPGMGIQKSGQLRDGLIVEHRIGVQEHHIGRRGRAGRQRLQHHVVAAPEPVVRGLGVKHQPVLPAARLDLPRNGLGIAIGGGIVHQMHLNGAPVMGSLKHTAGGIKCHLGGPVIYNDDGNFTHGAPNQTQTGYAAGSQRSRTVHQLRLFPSRG